MGDWSSDVCSSVLRHNVGFMAVDAIAEVHGFDPWRSRFHGWASEGRLGSIKVLLLKPATYMNESGRSIGEAMRFFKMEAQDVTVFHDELDLAPLRSEERLVGKECVSRGKSRWL